LTLKKSSSLTVFVGDCVS